MRVSKPVSELLFRCPSVSMLSTSTFKHINMELISVRCVTHVARGSHIGFTGVSICTIVRDGCTLLTMRALRGQLDLIAPREHVCWSKLAVQLCEGGSHLLPCTSKAHRAIWFQQRKRLAKDISSFHE